MLEALNEPNLDARVVEGLPWLAMTYADMDWDWLVRNAKVRDRQNRLGFALSLASELSERRKESSGRKTSAVVGGFGKFPTCARGYLLPRLDDSIGESVAARTSLARRGTLELLTDMKGEHLAYTSE